MNNHETAHVRKLIEACEHQRLQWIENGLNITKTNLKTLTGLLPHQDAFKYRYNS